MRVHPYQDAAGEWRWKLMSGSRIIADCGEGYKTKNNLHRALVRLQLAALPKILGGQNTEIGEAFFLAARKLK